MNGEGCLYQIEQGSSFARKIWESDWFSLTYAAGFQFLKQALVKTAYPVDVVIMNNRDRRAIHLQGSSEVQRVNLNLKGEVFKVALETDSPEVDISTLMVVVGFNR